uniref:NADH dehydrogenase [ubiquinone] 1 alpha subcomplex subunit 13 n=1 Tax=Dunaliella tertiolecta TaxID=3047 RepID=A0A6S8I396_DUNTE|mmetsp:Transcript_10511/g.28771  ORF Transcript_10511/g.28771 Transcript_10511/m.28771 type:complete len:143 (-) Transcript_10511:489-917(-)|eukprot:CAMPEP_0202374314 /NCGR_PEP_ID=MMETSP1127-20130417/5179_1 /ASSEMBLY_ACC=CAM_ASM_000462 /TAXON_ID=3047 /ORGANISM="Dunaliella tertiolecta, Strain CCMP1320" /LENGTH=142 /DNA_ID=CAMNT_0048971449 /DNA_START=113 /DNA_END=541 /DNA_ORIENTATION=-
MTEFLKRGVPGLSSIKDLPVTQDAPPPGGFPSIRIERRLPNTGPTGAAIFGIATAIMGYGFYQLWGAKRDKRFQADEIYTVRSIVHPVLVAEWDLRYLEHQRKEHEREAELMKNVPGWKVGEPTTKHRWLPPLESWARRSLL